MTSIITRHLSDHHAVQGEAEYVERHAPVTASPGWQPREAAMKSDVLDIAVQIHARTDRAILVSDDGDKDKAVWLPLSQIEVDMKQGGTAEITLPEWLALDKGLI